ncbi:MAG: manganese efflux pump [Clostridia bacterium]|nr:manganese efflux pump [Clostridia bacterium]
MGFSEVLLIGVALSMDACAIAMTNGMSEPKMPLRRTLLIALFFGFFQFLMPLIGYFVTDLIANAFLDVFEKISAWISFALLAFLGGKMIADCVKCHIAKKKGEEECECNAKSLTLTALLLQAVATSIDALAIGVSLNMEAKFGGGLLLGAFGSTALIGCTTFALSVAAVYIGKAVGNKLADKAELLGGIVLLAIGLKILIESFL